MSHYRVESCTLERVADIRTQWLDLQRRADCSYFQSWGWIATWLEQIAIKFNPPVIRVWLDDCLVGMGVFVSKEIKRHFIIHSRAMFLNETPFDGNNMVIEYNGLLVARGHEAEVYQRIIHFLPQQYSAYDEFYFSAVENKALGFLQKKSPQKIACIVNETSRSWYIDLSTLSVGVDAFLQHLSKNRRAQIRRSIRLYKGLDTLQIEEATDQMQAMHFFNGLKKLHTVRWQRVGQGGSFLNPIWESFHRALIENRFEYGEIQLLKVSNNQLTVGYLYNFIWQKHVYVLQTGFGDVEDKRLMPGYITHVLAIEHNRKKGMMIYDLMHGNSLYKKLLCDQSQVLYWVVMQRQRLKFNVEKLAAVCVRWLKKL